MSTELPLEKKLDYLNTLTERIQLNLSWEMTTMCLKLAYLHGKVEGMKEVNDSFYKKQDER